MKTFLSYCPADEMLATQIAGTLRQRGVLVWLDNTAMVRANLNHTTPAIESSDVICVLSSPGVGEPPARGQSFFEPFLTDGSRTLVRCSVSSFGMPPSTGETSPGCSGKTFEEGLAPLLAAIADQKALMQRNASSNRHLLDVLSEGDPDYFLNWELGRTVYLKADSETGFVKVPEHLQRLVSLALIDEMDTCCNDKWFDISQSGSRIRRWIAESGPGTSASLGESLSH